MIPNKSMYTPTQQSQSSKRVLVKRALCKNNQDLSKNWFFTKKKHRVKP